MRTEPVRGTESVVWVVSVQDDPPYGAWYVEEVHAAFATADSRIKVLAAMEPDWGVRVISYRLLIDGSRDA